jgi:hypothetical protein
MANLSLEIKEQQKYIHRNNNSADIQMINPNQDDNNATSMSVSPPSFTSTFFSCCTREWTPRQSKMTTIIQEKNSTEIQQNTIINHPVNRVWSIN